jgi:hypothetical protein
LAKLDNLEFSEEKGLKIEFWGGEPFVYWKTFKPLAEAIAKKFSEWKQPPKFSVITNGSLLTEDICAWLYAMGFSVAISHDGPGQYVRGPDPFDDPEAKKRILGFYRMMQALWHKKIANGHKARHRVHCVTTVPRQIPSVRLAGYSHFPYISTIFHPRHPTTYIRNVKSFFKIKYTRGGAK